MCATCDWQKSGVGFVCEDHDLDLDHPCERCGAKLCPKCAVEEPAKFIHDPSKPSTTNATGEDTSCFWCASGL